MTNQTQRPGDSDSQSSAINRLIEQYAKLDGALMPLLHGIQNQFGYIPKHTHQAIATALRLSEAEVRGVISFYHQFKTQAGGQHRVQICRAEACQANGSRELEQYAKTLLGIDYHQSSDDGLLSLDPVYCLGNCACGPSVRIDNQVHAEVDNTKLQALISELKGGNHE